MTVARIEQEFKGKTNHPKATSLLTMRNEQKCKEKNIETNYSNAYNLELITYNL